MAGFFMSNLPGKMLRPNPQTNAYAVALPIPTNSPIPLLDTEADTGKFVKGMLLNPQKTLGKRIYGATDYYTPEQIIDEFKAFKPEASKDAKAMELPHAVFKGILGKTGAPEPIQEEMLQNMLLMSTYGYFGGDSLAESQAVSDATSWTEVPCTDHFPH